MSSPATSRRSTHVDALKPGSASDAVLEAERRTPRPALLVAGMIAAVAVSYLPALSGGFIWDDRDIIENEPTVQELQPLHVYFQRRFFADDVQPDEDRGFYRPVVMISLAIDHAIGDGNPFHFHLTNLLLHLACCVLVFLLGRRAGASPPIAALTALAFGLLPRLTESVAWISGRTDLLAALGVLGALVVHRPKSSTARSLGAAVLLLFGLFAKEVAAAGFCVIAIREWRELPGSLGARLVSTTRRLVPFAISAAIYGALRLSSSIDAPIKHLNVPDGRRPIVMLETIGTYVWMLLAPLSPRTQIGSLGVSHPGMLALGIAVIVGTIALLVRLRKHPPAPATADALVLGAAAIAPVLHLIPLSVNVVAADRFLYLPAAAVAILGARGLSLAPQRVRTAAVTVVLALLPALAWSTRHRSMEWSHELLFWTRAVETAPPLNRLPIAALADVLFEHNREPESLDLYRQAARIEKELNEKLGRGHLPDDVKTQNSIAVTLSRMGRYQEAEAIFEGLVEAFPKYRRAHYNLALARARSLRFDEAEAALSFAKQRFPDHELPSLLLQEVRTHRAERAALPLESEDESPEITARRAALDEAQGRMLEARQGYGRVVSSDDAPVDVLRKAVGFLLVRGALNDAGDAVRRFMALHPNDDYVDVFVAMLEERQRQETLPASFASAQGAGASP